jgi:hypothetical protein
MTDKLTQDVHDIVDGIFKQKEEVAMRKETEEALNRSADMITKLNESLEAKDTELANIEAKNEELELTISELSTKAEELEKNLESAKSDFEAKEKELTEQLEAAQDELETIRKDQLAKARFEDLTNEGVAATDEQAVKDQIDKIREMSDEDFELYKTDRVELRKSVIAELEASVTETEEETNEAEAVTEEAAEEETTEEEVVEEETASEEETSEEEESEEASEEETEVQLEDEEEAAAESEDSIDPMKAMSAMLNIEAVPTEDIQSKYREMGKAMAEKFKR